LHGVQRRYVPPFQPTKQSNIQGLRSATFVFQGSGTHPIPSRPTHAVLTAPLFRFQPSHAPAYTLPRTPTLSFNNAFCGSSIHPCSALPPPPSHCACDRWLVAAGRRYHHPRVAPWGSRLDL
jgi:hypothetical protein